MFNTNISTLDIEKETAKAYGINFGGGVAWFPKSQVSIDWQTEANHNGIRRGVFSLPKWLARNKGMYFMAQGCYWIS